MAAFIPSYLLMHMVPPYESIPKSQLHLNLLPPKSSTLPSHTLVLDLDETLVHCYLEKPEKFDITFQVCAIPAVDRRSVMRKCTTSIFASAPTCSTSSRQ